MKLKKLLPKRKITIEYRTCDPFGQDILAGVCEWDGKTLIPLDGDLYYVDDEISSYVWENNNHLIIWYLSEWITGDENEEN